MKKLLLLLPVSVFLFFVSCQKEDLTLSMQRVELHYYAFQGSTTPVTVTWAAQDTVTGSKTFVNTGFVKFAIPPEATMEINVTPESVNDFLNSFFQVTVNDVPVRAVKFYNDAAKNTTGVHLSYHPRQLKTFNITYTHHTNDANTTHPCSLTYLLNDTVYQNIQELSSHAKAGDLVTFGLEFFIPPGVTDPVYHEFIMKINGETVRYDYIKRKTCGQHKAEMSVVLEPYL